MTIVDGFDVHRNRLLRPCGPTLIGPAKETGAYLFRGVPRLAGTVDLFLLPRTARAFHRRGSRQ
jgi:hypothetical protein